MERFWLLLCFAFYQQAKSKEDVNEMLSNYQILEQLRLLKKLLTDPYDSPRKEALEYAITASIEKMENRDPCIFDFENKCRILTSKDCFQCKFKCTEKQYNDSQEKVRKRHEKIGIKVIKGKNGYEYFHIDKRGVS